MKNTILSNLIDFAVYFEIQEVDHEQAAFSRADEDIPCNSSWKIKRIDPNLLWMTLLEDFKFDKTSIHLLENFSDALEREDYLAAKIMKQEILNLLGISVLWCHPFRFKWCHF
ncbi:MAG TPA: hypothetical protein VK050_05520 [Flavobacteriaceae bacterium]|nr:hypothetical protein [Flavobacteriaceae bacterium]